LVQTQAQSGKAMAQLQLEQMRDLLVNKRVPSPLD
jgi:hypothetical protein